MQQYAAQSAHSIHIRLTFNSVQRLAERRACLLSYSQAEPGRESTQPSPRLLALETHIFDYSYRGLMEERN